LAVRAKTVAAEFGEEDSHMHSIDFALQPVEEAAHAIPLALIIALVVIRFTFHDEGFVLLRHRFEGLIGAYTMTVRGPLQVAETFAVNLALEGPDRALVDGQAGIGDNEPIINFDDSAKTAAGE